VDHEGQRLIVPAAVLIPERADPRRNSVTQQADTSRAGSAPAAATQTAIVHRGLGRRYGRTVALADVDLDIREGEVHAIVGENGAGKSTCLSILAGRVVPSAGEVRFFGETIRWGDPRRARAAGIAAIYQELTVIPALSTQANVFLGQERSSNWIVQERAMKRRLGELCEELGVSVPADVPAGSLSISGQQLVEIMRALTHNPRAILFDEPTAALAARERAALHEVIRKLKRRGVTVVFVSHNLDEILELSDTVTVFRGGHLVASKPAALWTKPELVHTMTGREVEAAVTAGRRRERQPGAPVLSVTNLRTRRLRNVSFEVGPGEILGIGGLVGSGRSTLLKALAGDIPESGGTMVLDGRDIAWPSNVRRARSAGIVLVPEDRKSAGLFPGLSAIENIAMGSMSHASRFGVVSRRRLREAAAEASHSMGFASDRLDELAGNLSGGNQQKLLLARAVSAQPKVLLADEPTRGIDVGAKAEIMSTLRQLAAQGLAVITVSSELEELELLCDRVIVLSGGEMVGRFDERDQISVNAILNMAFRVEEAA
jgi:ABC-type sugar transport system ATPase subunit